MSTLPIRIVIPDTGVLISLAHGGLLETLFSFVDGVEVAITDVVEFEATRNLDWPDARSIREFLDRHASRIHVAPTAFHELLARVKVDKTVPVPKNLGELSIYAFVNDILQDVTAIPSLVLFEDEWFIRNQYVRPRNTRLVSLVAFLTVLSERVPGFSLEEAMARIRHTRPWVNPVVADIPADADEEHWAEAVRPALPL